MDEEGHQNPDVAYDDGREDGVADFAHVSTGEDAHVEKQNGHLREGQTQRVEDKRVPLLLWAGKFGAGGPH